MFETNNISIEESYILKRVLRGFRQLRSLILWRVCDDAMLQILGVTCHHLLEVDIWKSTAATDAGVRMFLGLDAERPFRCWDEQDCQPMKGFLGRANEKPVTLTTCLSQQPSGCVHPSKELR